MKSKILIFRILATAICLYPLLSTANDNIDQLMGKAAKGAAAAQCELGLKYLEGVEIEKNVSKAHELLLKSAEQCYVPAYSHVAYTYYLLKPVGWSDMQMDWLRKAAEANDPQGTYEYAMLVPDDKARFSLWLKAAVLGYAQAFAKVAEAYFYGEATEVNYQEAIKWYRQAMTQPDADPNLYCNYARSYLLAYDDVESLNKGFELLIEGESKGMTDSIGFILLGNYYEFGKGGALLDFDEAMRWYTKAQSEEDIARLKNKISEPKINSSKPEIAWENMDSVSSRRKYEFTVNVKTETELEEVRVYINNTQDRGFSPVDATDEILTIHESVTLHPGKNDLRVKAKNAGGWNEISRNVYYAPQNVQGDRRIALLIGNGEYLNSDASLDNPPHDIEDVSTKLESLGFKVTTLYNLTKKRMEEEIDQFKTASNDYDIVFFYYAGHGLNSNGINYLMPIDANMQDESEVKDACFSLTELLNRVNTSKMNIVVLDACRNNPVTKSWHRGKNTEDGLLPLESMPKGVFISFSTAAGDPASDGVNGHLNSPFATAFLETLDKPNIPLTEVFRQIGEKVIEDTMGRQTPCYYSGFTGQFYFNQQ